MVKRFLITTALEDTWRDDVPVLFLGEWCRRYDRRQMWQGLDSKVVPYHWDDRQKFHQDYWYLRDPHEELMTGLGDQLNKLHGVQHSIRYWRILTGSSSHSIILHKIVCELLDATAMDRIVEMILRMGRPLLNALGGDWRNLFDRDKILNLYRCM